MEIVCVLLWILTEASQIHTRIMFLLSGADVYGPGIAMATGNFRCSHLLFRLSGLNVTFNDAFAWQCRAPNADEITAMLKRVSRVSGVPASPLPLMEVVELKKKKKVTEWFSAVCGCESVLLWLCMGSSAELCGALWSVSTQSGIINPLRIFICINTLCLWFGCGCGLAVVWLCRAVGRCAGSVAAPGASRVPAACERGRERTLRPPLTQERSDLGRSGPRTPAEPPLNPPLTSRKVAPSQDSRLGSDSGENWIFFFFFLVERRLSGESRVCLSFAVVFVRGFCDDVAVFISKTERKTNYGINNRWVWLAWEHSM